MIPQIILFGPECSGKTTLAQNLQMYYDGILVPEYLRSYAQSLWDAEQRIVDQRDVINLINGQCQSEQVAFQNARKGVFGEEQGMCAVFYDTNIQQLEVYFDYYFGSEWGELPLDVLPQKNECIYLLTRPDIPWQADDLRDRPLEREALFGIFESYLKRIQANYVTVSGDIEARMALACCMINKTWPHLNVEKT